MGINFVPWPNPSRSQRLQRKQSVIARTQSRRKSRVARASSLTTIPNPHHRPLVSEADIEVETGIHVKNYQEKSPCLEKNTPERKTTKWIPNELLF